MYKFEDVVQDQAGNALGKVAVTVYVAGSTNLASLYANDGVTPIGNPVYTDTSGYVTCRVPNGTYDLSYALQGQVLRTRVGLQFVDVLAQIQPVVAVAPFGNNRGTYAQNTAYASGDYVLAGNGLPYYCILGYTSPASGGDPTTDATHWLLEQVDVLLRGQLANPAAGFGADMIGFQIPETGGVATKVSKKLQQFRTLEDFGVVDDPTFLVDQTAAWNKVIAFLNARPYTTLTAGLLRCATGVLNPLTANDITFLFDSVVLRPLPNTLAAANTTLFTATGNRFHTRGFRVDGNQAACSGGGGGQLVALSGDGHIHVQMEMKNSQGRGAVFSGLTNSAFGYSSFNNNCNLGFEASQCSYLTFLKVDTNQNGAGFNKAKQYPGDTNNNFVAFGHAFRYRTHHVTLDSCNFKLNGRDGSYLGEGCYAFKYAKCLAWGNDDGGFTLNADLLNTGLPGDGEPCYDIEYEDCESYANYSGGLVITAACPNVSVRGGRYYNNGRALGMLATASAYGNGVYVGGGSTSVSIDTKAYDDRQSRTITAVSGSGTTRTLTAPGWVDGTMTSYPRVCLYDGNMAFIGYGTITAEAAGSVTISSTAFNGVSLAALTVGQFISQRTQHNGVFADNGCTGEIHNDGFGFSQGALGVGLTGYSLLSGGFAAGQNIRLPKMQQNAIELLTNPSFDAATTGWTFALPGGGTQGLHTGANRRSPGSLQLVGGSGQAVGDATLLTDSLKYTDGTFVVFKMWVLCSVPAGAGIQLFYGTGPFASTVLHPGGGQWRLLEVGAFMPVGNANLIARVLSQPGVTAYFDSGSLRSMEPYIDQREVSPVSRYLPV